MKLPGFPGGNKNRRKKSTKKTTTRKKKAQGRQAGVTPLTWVLLAAIVILFAGIGLVKWAGTGPGQATLLTLGSDGAFAEVQSAVESVLVSRFPEFRPGALAADGGGAGDYDWPALDLGPEAMIRCRLVSVPEGVPYEQIQLDLDRALRRTGARVLWGQVLYPETAGEDQRRPNQAKDLLRLDLGVGGKPTHTLVVHRHPNRPHLTWGNQGGTTQWDRLVAEAAGPVVALLIDDWGNSRNTSTSGLLKLPAPLTMAVLPRLSYSRHFALKATDLVLPPQGTVGIDQGQVNHSEGRPLRLAAGCFVELHLGQKPERAQPDRREVILHLPMEPQGFPETNPGDNPLVVGMKRGEIASLIDEARGNVPGFRGLNNHMGSAATSDPQTMTALMEVLREKGLYFVDSLTTSRSVAFDQALAAGVPALRNRIFLDYDNKNQVTIAANLEVVVRSARAKGFALGIGHPYPATVEVLKREIPRLQEQGVVFVTVSEMLALMQVRANDGSS